MVDLMRVPDKPAGAKELEKLGVDYLNMHVSIDKQMIAHTPLQELKAVTASTSIPVAVAGGLNSETVGEALKAGPPVASAAGRSSRGGKARGRPARATKAAHRRKRSPRGRTRK